MTGPRFEIEPCPTLLGGGWRLHLVSTDPETGEDVFMWGGNFPVSQPEDGGSMYAEAAKFGKEWLESRSADEE